MPLALVKKPKAPKNPAALVPPPTPALAGDPLTSWLDLANKSPRTPVGWLLDGSPSMTGFTQVQLDGAGSMVVELRRNPSTARSVLFNMVQIGTPPVATGFREIAAFEVPALNTCQTTPLHAALERMAADLGGLCSDLRGGGIERTDSVVVITTDGFANGATPEEVWASIDAFMAVGKKWSVTNIVVGVGSKLNVPLLTRLSNELPPLRIEELNAGLLLPFVQKIARQVSESRRGQKIELELPDGIETLE